ncbi:MAG: hypothetical protein IAE83_03785 [Anaerolinea sp.]|nr:hypothetical protein [Anaerolinea sp.]
MYYIGWVKTRQAAGEQRTPQNQNHPQSPKDCPECAAQHGACVEDTTAWEVEAWSKRKGKRGAQKRWNRMGASAITRTVSTRGGRKLVSQY